MGSNTNKFWTGLCSNCFSCGLPPAKVILLGVNAAGKTAILYRLKLNDSVPTIPILGFQVEDFTLPGLKVAVWEVSGGYLIRRLIPAYFEGAEGFIFVVDACDHESFPEARGFLEDILKAEKTPRGIPVVVMANKQDLPGAADTSKVTDELHLRDIQSYPWSILGTSATTGDGVHEGLEMIAEMIKAYRKEM